MSLHDAITSALRTEPGASPFVTRRTPSPRTVVSVLDEFSQSCFAPVANLHAIGPIRPELDLDRLEPDLLLVESAWNGNQGRWRYQVTSNSGPRDSFRHLVAASRSRGIPTVFWNKEDPVHYDEFIETAKLFDVVLTTDGDLLDQYRADVGHDRVDLLRFAAEPTLHNPRRVQGHRDGDIAFAGQYFRHKYPERRTQTDVLFAAAQHFGFAIFSRMLGGDPNYQFPEQYERFIKGSLPYARMVEEYKRHKIFLNVNSVTSSTTMCARRVFELSAAKTVVVSMESAAIRSVFQPDEVVTVRSTREAREVFATLIGDPTRRAAIAQRAWRRVAREHTMIDRVHQIRRLVGMEIPEKPIDVVLHTRDDECSPELVQDLERQTFLQNPGSTVTLVVHGNEHREQLRTGRLHVVSARERPELDPTFVGHVSGGLRYGRHYLEDQALVLTKFVPECVVTKPRWGLDGTLPERDEQEVTQLTRGAWLARTSIAGVEDLIHTSLAGNGDGLPSPVPAYEADAFNVAPRSGAPNTEWDS